MRAAMSWVLLVLACLLAVVSVISVFVRNELLNTDTYVSTVAPLASNPAIQTAVASKVSQQLVTRINLQQEVKQALPPHAGFLAAPITNELESAANRIVLKFVQSSAFQKLWNVANRRSHQQMVNLLTGQQQGAFNSSNGQITVDLSQVEAQAKKALDAKGVTVFDKLPTTKATNLVLFQSKQLVSAQKLTRLVNDLVFVLPIITLLLFAGAVLLTRNRRKGLVRGGGDGDLDGRHPRRGIGRAERLPQLTAGRTVQGRLVGGHRHGGCRPVGQRPDHLVRRAGDRSRRARRGQLVRSSPGEEPDQGVVDDRRSGPRLRRTAS